MANVENPYNTTLQNSLVVTTNMNDIVTINFSINGVDTNTISPSTVTIAKGSSLNDSGIVLDLQLADINEIFTINDENYSFEYQTWGEFLNHKFMEDCNIVINTQYTRVRYSIDILDSSYNDVHCHPEFSEPYTITCPNQHEAFRCEYLVRETPMNYNGSSALNFLYLVFDQQIKPLIDLTIPSDYDISEVYVTNMPYPADNTYAKYLHKTEPDADNNITYTIELKSDGLINNDYGFVISKI